MDLLVEVCFGLFLRDVRGCPARCTPENYDRLAGSGTHGKTIHEDNILLRCRLTPDSPISVA